MWMTEVDHVANRVGLCTFSGFWGGAVYATLRGLPLRRVALSAAASCALVATSVFGMERLAHVTLQQLILPPPTTKTTTTNPTTTSTSNTTLSLLLMSHVFAGIAGGGLNGYLYHKKPLRGMVWFLPVMMGVAGVEWTLFQRKPTTSHTTLTSQGMILNEQRDKTS
jgi:hypothetical protein